MNIIMIVGMVVLLAGGADVFCQTKMIAHKSHSGGIESFSVNGSDNFGLDMPDIDSVVRLTDTSVLRFPGLHGRVDTVYKGRSWPIDLFGDIDELRKGFPGTKFIGFDRKKKQSKYVPKPTRKRNSPARRDSSSRRTSPTIGLMDESGYGDRMLLLVLGVSVALPSIGYGIWRSETRRVR